MKKDVVYTKVDTTGGGVKVVSKRQVVSTKQSEQILQEKFAKIEASRLAKEAELAEKEAEIAEKEAERVTVLSQETDLANRRILWITHLNVFIYATCFFIQNGTLPYLTKKLGADPVTFGSLQTAFSVCQLVGGPLYGRVGDVFGERTAIIVALLSTTMTYLITGVSYSLPVLFASRLFSVLMHVMQGSQMVATALSTPDKRAGALARLGFSYGLGMVVGPSLGGLINKNFGLQFAALVAASGSLFSLLLVVVFVPNIDKSQVTKDNTGVFNFKKMIGLVALPKVHGLLLLKAVCGIPTSILESMFTVFAMQEFGLAPDQNGFLMSYIGVLSLLMQGAGVSFITSRFSDLRAINFSAFTLALSFYAMSLLTGLTDFLVLLAPIVFSLSLTNSVISSRLTKVVSPTDTGAILGINMAVGSVIRTLAPTLGGWMMSTYGFRSIGVLGAFCHMSVLFLTKHIQF